MWGYPVLYNLLSKKYLEALRALTRALTRAFTRALTGAYSFVREPSGVLDVSRHSNTQ
jgi:hypothetical protein